MTKDQAIEAMNEGLLVRHHYFTKDEFMFIDGDRYMFEDGCSCSPEFFWSDRTDDYWNTGWEIVSRQQEDI